MGPFKRKFPKTRIPEKSRKRLSRIRKFFKGDYWIAPKLKQFVTQSIIRTWYFLWLILLLGTQLRHILQIYTNKLFSSSSCSCLPMKICEPEVYAKHIVQPWEIHCACIFCNNLSLKMLVVTKIFPKFLKVNIRFSHILISWKKYFIIH